MSGAGLHSPAPSRVAITYRVHNPGTPEEYRAPVERELCELELEPIVFGVDRVIESIECGWYVGASGLVGLQPLYIDGASHLRP